MSTPELKPCPFCGKQPEGCENRSYAFARCKPCGIKWHSVEGWNTRHSPAESALNAAREWNKNAHDLLAALEKDYNHPWPNEDEATQFHRQKFLVSIHATVEALAQISPQQSKTT